jgi:hypothetical protein
VGLGALTMPRPPFHRRLVRDPWVLGSLALIALAVMASALGFETASFDGFQAGFHAVPLDDSWIHYVYAESLGFHGRLDYNPGQAEAGFTSLAWVAALAPLLRLGVEACLASKLLGLGALTGLAATLFLWLRSLGQPALAAAVALVVAAEPVFGFAALSGMEVMAFALAMVLSTALLLSGRWSWAAGALTLTILTRPDGVILLAFAWSLALAHRLLPRLFTGRPPPWRSLALLVLLPSAAAGAWALYCHGATGRWLPNAYFLRTHELEQLWGPDKLLMLVRQTMDAFLPLASPWKALWLVGGAVYALVRWRGWGLLLLAFPTSFALALGLGAVDVLNGTFQGNRYLVPVYPFLLLLQALGIAGLLALVRQLLPLSSRRGRWLLPSLAVALLLPLLLPPTAWLERRAESQQHFAQACKNIEEMQVALGRWVRDQTAPDAVIATHDAGAIRYLGRRHTIDVVGLNTTTPGMAYQDPAVLKRHADWLITFDGRTPQLAWAYRDRLHDRVVLEDNLVCAEPTMAVYRLSGDEGR